MIAKSTPKNYLELLQNEFGSNDVVSAADIAKNKAKITWLDTGSYTLNKCINYQGFGIPTSYLVEFFGESASGKTLFALYLLKDCIKKGGTAILIDVEHAFDIDLAIQIGIDLKKLLIIQPLTKIKDKYISITIEEVFNRTNFILNSSIRQFGANHLTCIVWDSLGATPSERDLTHVMDQGLNARIIKQRINTTLPLINNTNTLFLVLNHVYDVISRVPTAEPKKAYGGKATEFRSQIRVNFISKKGKAGKIEDEEGGFIKGTRLHFNIQKDRIAPAHRYGTIDLLFDKDGRVGLDYYSGYMDYLLKVKAIRKSGGWYKYTDSKGEDHSYHEADIERLLKEFPELLGV